eukprot:TRINITY_DN13956_c0_g1_i1.p1 TRINITY_DN13956_c0_g1~~TRINITY_DN13956_c0_g1_i1.p1  ORF type:complete len:186 (+),score=23.80 TRINITY_DN13956_c0_g1_i1:40-558(+)
MTPKVKVIDITYEPNEMEMNSRWCKFNAYYPHGKIFVRAANVYTECLRGAYEAYKRFDDQEVDVKKLTISVRRNLLRRPKKKGDTVWWELPDGTVIKDPVEARKLLFVEPFKWLLEHTLSADVARLRKWLDSGKEILILNRSVKMRYWDYVPEETFNTHDLLRLYLVGMFPI